MNYQELRDYLEISSLSGCAKNCPLLSLWLYWATEARKEEGKSNMVKMGDFLWNWRRVLACRLNVGFLEPVLFWAALLLCLRVVPFAS